MNLQQIIDNPSSLTKILRGFGAQFSISLLASGMDGNYYRRTIVEYLDNIPVVMATSVAKFSDVFFVNLLKNASTNPIGDVLFAENTQVQRHQMVKNVIQIEDISNKQIMTYLIEAGYDYSQVIDYRVSTFVLNEERLQITEYFLPTLNQFIQN